jgi:hypothetical protein
MPVDCIVTSRELEEIILYSYPYDLIQKIPNENELSDHYPIIFSAYHVK